MSMPTVFVSHGSPMLFLEQDLPARAFLATLGKLVPRPKAIVAVSAHWNTEQPAVSLAREARDHPRFLWLPRRALPPALRCAGRARACRTRRGADGRRARSQLRARPRRLGAGDAGLAEADIPIFQLSVQPYMTPAHHIALGRKLSGLREEGVLVMGSGSATHNLRRLVRGQHDTPPEPWAKAFDDWVAETVEKGDEAALANYRSEAPHARDAHPTDEHFLPLHVAFGAAGKGAHGRALHRSFTSGNLSMAAYAFA